MSFRYTMTKSTAIIFLLLFAILFKLEKAVSVSSCSYECHVN